MPPHKHSTAPEHPKRIAAGRYLLAVGAAVVAACGGSSSGAKPPRLVAELRPAARDTDSPEIVLRGSGADAHFWTNDAGAVIAGLWTSATAATTTRVTWTPSGSATRIDDVTTGAFLLLEERNHDRVDCAAYDVDGRFMAGFAVTSTPSGHAWSNILARAPITGQLAGQITLPSMSGSFALITDPAPELGPLASLPADMVATAEWAATGSGGTAQELRFARNLCAIFRAPAVFGGRWQEPCAATAALRLLAGVRGHALADCIDSRFVVSDGTAQECIDLALRQLSSRSAPPLVDFVWTWITNLGDGTVLTLPAVADLRADLEPSTAPVPDVGRITLPTTKTLPVDGPPLVEVGIRGQAILQSGAFYPLTGTVYSTGLLDCSGLRDGNVIGDRMVCMGQIERGTFQGTCTVAGSIGTCQGTGSPLGECNTANESGGEGTFTFAHYIGPGTGTVAFEYQAFSIPDQFIVRTAAGERFHTGGLVSGGARVAIAIRDEPVAFVSVSAPDPRTRWRYSLGCLE